MYVIKLEVDANVNTLRLNRANLRLHKPGWSFCGCCGLLDNTTCQSNMELMEQHLCDGL